MFAVIKTGGKQYKVAKDDYITVEKLKAEAGATVELSEVLMVGESGKDTTIDAGALEKAVVTAEVVEQSRADKIIVFKKKRRQNYRRKAGHRQEQTVLKITDISTTGKKATGKKAAAKKAAPKKAEAETKAEPVAKKAAPKKEAAAKKPAAKKPAAKKPAAKSKSKE